MFSCSQRRSLCVACSVVIGLLPWSAQVPAADLSLLAGYQISSDFENETTEERIKLDESASFALALDFAYRGKANEKLGLYLNHQRTAYSEEADLEDSDLSITYLHFTAQSLWPQGNWEPYLMLGIGVTYFSPADSSLSAQTFLSGQIAGGASYGVTDSFRLRGGVRWLPTFFNGSSAVFCDGGCNVAVKSSIWSQGVFELGLQFRF